jgi:cytochrome c oxidase cbb3-type subunit 1
VETAQQENYSFRVVRWFAVMAIIYLVIGALLGTYIAAELAWPKLNFDIHYLNFGRLRPLHSHIAIFAFGGCALMAAAFYTVQQTCRVRLWSSTLGWFVFWGWNLIMIYVVTTLNSGHLYSPAGYAALKMVIAIATAVVWAIFILNFSMTIIARTTERIHISNWFFLGMMVMATCLAVVKSATTPLLPADNYTQFSGALDAGSDYSLVLFLLTIGFLGAMYHFLPQQTSRPIYSNRLAVVHFLALMIGCIWLGIQFQTYFAVPAWIGSLGGAVSLAVLLSSVGAVINFIMIVSGDWTKLRTDYVLRFLILALVFFAISIGQNPVFSFNMSDDLSNYTDWTAGSGHSDSLGLVIMIIGGAIYPMIERLWNIRIYSARLVNLHLWVFFIGITVYFSAMKLASIAQGLMWRAYDEHGNLAYTFAESVEAMHPYYIARAIGGILFWAGTVFMLYNTTMTIRLAARQRRDRTEATQAS